MITAATRDAICQAGHSEKNQLRDAQRKSQQLQTNIMYKKEIHTQMRVLKQGWLDKKGYFVRAWRRRYFVLQMESVGKPKLNYFRSPDTSVPQGTIGILISFVLQFVDLLRQI